MLPRYKAGECDLDKMRSRINKLVSVILIDSEKKQQVGKCDLDSMCDLILNKLVSVTLY